MKQIKIKCNINYNSPRKQWVDVIKYHGRKEYGFIWFKNKLNQMEMKEDRENYSDSIFFFIGDDVVMEQNEKYEWLYVHYGKIWSFFHPEFGYSWQEISNLIRSMVEEHFKMKSFTPTTLTVGLIVRWKTISKNKPLLKSITNKNPPIFKIINNF